MSKQQTTVSSREVYPQSLTSEADSAVDGGASVLDEIVRRVVEVAEPERIILFGSAARRESRPDSDIDLLVVKEGAHRRKLSQAIYRQLLGIGRSVDVVVVTPEDIERYRDAVGLVIMPAVEEGRTIYAALSLFSRRSQRVAESSAQQSGQSSRKTRSGRSLP